MPNSFHRYSDVKSKLDYSKFDCGNVSLNAYIQKYVSQDEKKKLCRAYVLLNDANFKLLGYYTLSASSVQFENFPDNLKKHFPKYPIPVALIGRLAVDKLCQGQGIGGELLADALKCAVRIANEIGIVAVIVEAIDQSAVNFYQKMGFIPFLDSPFKLVLPINAIQQLIGPKKSP